MNEPSVQSSIPSDHPTHVFIRATLNWLVGCMSVYLSVCLCVTITIIDELVTNLRWSRMTWEGLEERGGELMQIQHSSMKCSKIRN